MRNHAVLLEVAGGRLAGDAPTKLPVMYDVAMARFKGTAQESIEPKRTLQLEVSFNIVENAVESARSQHDVVATSTVTDWAAGYYVLLTRLRSGVTLLEAGRAVVRERQVAEQFMAKAW